MNTEIKRDKIKSKTKLLVGRWMLMGGYMCYGTAELVINLAG